ncbi:hypothetical protein CKA32_003624 [Geitlerinema sp. FC II]|nr:hypothetical protein [Geitlerinema sp. CS-897]PPT08691.1 hypothetical protein CKA32_003624 [Geitlerinema sp. FC II]
MSRSLLPKALTLICSRDRDRYPDDRQLWRITSPHSSQSLMLAICQRSRSRHFVIPIA